MFQNYLKTAYRNILRYKAFSFINLFGLALSMSVCLLIIMLIKDAYSYDLFHPKSERAYRIITKPDRKNGRSETYAPSPYMVAKTLADDYTQVELWTPLVRNFSGALQYGEKSFDFNGLLTGPSFFEMFGFELEQGSPAEALESPYSIVLAHELAERMFPNENPIGKALNIPGFAAGFRVTGVLKPFPGKTHLEFTALGSLSTQLAEEKLPGADNVTGEWRDYYSVYNFVRLKAGVDKSAAELALADIANTRYQGLELESRDRGYAFALQPLGDITPSMPLSYSMGNGMPVFLIWFLSALGLAILLSACFNYTNLAIARSFQRSREVGVRKVLGAAKGQVFWQFINESVLTALLALLLAYPLMKLAKLQFARLSFTEFMDIDMREDLALFGLFLAFAGIAGLMAGLLPALALSRTKPMAVLQKFQNATIIRKIGLRKVLLVVQFTLALFFLIIVTITWRQVSHAMAVNFGFGQPSTLLVNLQGQAYGKASAALSQVNGVEQVSAISHVMGTWQDGSTDVRTSEDSEKTGVRHYFIDHQYLNHFGIKLVAGEDFPENLAQQHEHFAIVNETFARQFQLGSPEEAIGKPLLLGDSTQVAVRGVVKDFPFKPAVYAMEPLLLRYDPAQLQVLNLRLDAKNIPARLVALEKAWKELDSSTSLDASFFDETVRENYSNILDLARIVAFFGLMGMVIACLGLLGITIYMVESKAKEISIRKVLGARAGDIVLYLSKGYLLLFAIAVVIAAPASFLVGNKLLQAFADRIAWSPMLFLPGVLLLLAFAALTTGSQTVRAALSNPADSLRSE